MYLTGFADEAANDIDGQIKATKELGWENIEARNINEISIHDIRDDEFDVVYGKLQDAGVKINCFGSAIGNWGKRIDESFDSSLEEAKRAIPRMHLLGTKMIRIMSFAVLPERESDDQMEEERFRRLRILQSMFTDAGLIPLHENCSNYGGMGWQFTLRLLENVPGLKLVFDTGNPVFADDRGMSKPHPKQSAWEFYSHVKEHIAYVHIKDGYWDYNEQKSVCTWPGDGLAGVRLIVNDLLSGGYDGGFSIEPHMAVVHHDPSITAEEAIKYANYIEYGQKMAEIIDQARKHKRN